MWLAKGMWARQIVGSSAHCRAEGSVIISKSEGRTAADPVVERRPGGIFSGGRGWLLAILGRAVV